MGALQDRWSGMYLLKLVTKVEEGAIYSTAQKIAVALDSDTSKVERMLVKEGTIIGKSKDLKEIGRITSIFRDAGVKVAIDEDTPAEFIFEEQPETHPVRQQAHPVRSRAKPKKTNGWFWLGVVVLPYIFAWFTLRKTFTKSARIGAFSWLVVYCIILAVTPEADTQANSTYAETQELEAESQRDRELALKRLEEDTKELAELRAEIAERERLKNAQSSAALARNVTVAKEQVFKGIQHKLNHDSELGFWSTLDGNGILQLSGDDSDIKTITWTVALGGNEDFDAVNFLIGVEIIKNIFPSWSAGPPWYLNSATENINSRKTIRRDYIDKKLEVNTYGASAAVAILTIKL